MLAVRLPALGEQPVLEDVPVPSPSGFEVLVRVAACGVCRTDLHIVQGSQTRVSPPVTLGHEIAGWVAAYGPALEADPPLPLDTAVAVYGGWGCGSCAQCAAGLEQRCDAGRSPGFQVDGGWAEYVLVPSARHLVPLGSQDPVRAAPLADAGVTPYRAVERARPFLRPGARVLLIGFGALGQFALRYLRRLPDLDVTVHDVNPRKLALAESLASISGPSPSFDGEFDVIFDFVGTDATLADAAGVVAPGGLISIVGEGGGGLPVSFASPAVEAWVTTTAWGSLDDLRAVVALAPELDWTVEPMPVRDHAVALDRLARGEVAGRIVLVP
jgi:propanol-preferring alcohol dehydrogenase